MRPPCEIVVNSILPTVRAELVKVLITDYKLRQVDVAELLGITQASVSQYRAASRGKDQELRDTFPEIERIARDVAKRIVDEGKPKEEPWIPICDMCKIIICNPKFKEYKKNSRSLEGCSACQELE